MKISFAPHKRSQVNRRAFLRGVGSVAVALPFLESMPWRSAWAQDAEPVFSFFLCHSCGVVGKSFWPTEVGALTTEGLAGQGRAVSELSAYASRLLIVNGVTFPSRNSGCGHAQGLCQVLTGRGSNGAGGNQAQSTGPSVDTDIAAALNSSGTEPLALYAGLKGGYINERLSFSEAGKVRPAEGDPYQVYKDLIGLTGGSPITGEPVDPEEMQPVIDEISVRRNSVNDLVREELNNLLAQSVLSTADRQRIERHIAGIRDLEMGMGNSGMITSRPELVEGAFSEVSGKHRQNGMQEQVAHLHMQLVAYAFASNLNRTATLQVGDGTDATVYDVPSNSRRWGFHFVSHRTQSDGSVGSDQQAEAAHAEIDTLRMQNFKKGLDVFASYTTPTGDLLDNAFFLWTNHIADGPSHNYNNVPMIVAGSGGGFLKQGMHIDAGGVTNDKLLNTLKTAAGLATDDMIDDMIA